MVKRVAPDLLNDNSPGNFSTKASRPCEQAKQVPFHKKRSRCHFHMMLMESSKAGAISRHAIMLLHAIMLQAALNARDFTRRDDSIKIPVVARTA